LYSAHSKTHVLDVESSTSEPLSAAGDQTAITTSTPVKVPDSLNAPEMLRHVNLADKLDKSMSITTFYGSRKRKPTRPYSVWRKMPEIITPTLARNDSC